MHQYKIPFKQGKANLIALLGGDNPCFTDSIKHVEIMGVLDAAGEEANSSYIGFKGGPVKREANGYTADIGPFVVRVDYQTGLLETWGQEHQDHTLVIGIELENLNRRSA